MLKHLTRVGKTCQTALTLNHMAETGFWGNLLGIDLVGYLYQKAQNQRERGDLQGAVATFSQVLERDPSHIQGWVERGIAYLELQEYQQALDNFSTLIRLEPEEKAAYVLTGLAYYYLESFPAAIAYCNRAIRMDISYGVAYLIRGAAYAEQSNRQAAIADIERARALFQDQNLEEGNKLAALILSQPKLQRQGNCDD
jgi:tetratricopeptide (TPR) repeat protein